MNTTMIDDHGCLTAPRMAAAVDELQGMILRQYPGTEFTVGYGDEPEGVHLIATVDLDDPDEVVDLVIDRMLELQIEEKLPLYVIPVRTSERQRRLLAKRMATRVPARTH